jgi:hypothetical protein
MVPGIWIFYAKGTGHNVSLLSSTAKQVKSGLDPFSSRSVAYISYGVSSKKRSE